jgi:lipoyl(octanoyl) transferase
MLSYSHILHSNSDVSTCVWQVWGGLTPYKKAVAFMEERVAQIALGNKPETILALEHPSLYTAGTSAHPSELIDPHRFPVFETGRGGRFTYHGPGQRVVYVMLNLKKRALPGSIPDVRGFVRQLEEWIIRTLAQFSIVGERREGRVGIWVTEENTKGEGGRESKIAALGVRIRNGVSFHGISLNINPDLSAFSGIVPCGLKGENYGVTSLQALGASKTYQEVDAALQSAFQNVFKVEIMKNYEDLSL